MDTRIWNDEKFMGLSDSGKLAFLLVMTNPHMTSLGAMRSTLPGLAAELGWSAAKFRNAFGEAIQARMAEYDERAAFVALPNFLRYNSPDNPNVVASWKAVLDLLPECQSKTRLVLRCARFVQTLHEDFGRRLPEPFTKALANGGGTQEQEQEQEQISPPVSPPAGRGGTAGARGADLIPAEMDWRVQETWRVHLEAWRRFCREENGGRDPGGPPPTLTPKIRKAILDGLKLYDRPLLGPLLREQWTAQSKVRAAGIGIYLSKWHTATDPKNDRRNGGTPYLDHWRPWHTQRGKDSKIEEFASLYFKRKSRG